MKRKLKESLFARKPPIKAPDIRPPPCPRFLTNDIELTRASYFPIGTVYLVMARVCVKAKAEGVIVISPPIKRPAITIGGTLGIPSTVVGPVNMLAITVNRIVGIKMKRLSIF